MKIALIGYGKMGKAIEEIATGHGHIISLKITTSNLADLTQKNLQQCDVAIEFTNPENAVNNMKACINAGIPVVCGSTGWTEQEGDIKNYCLQHDGTLIYASNFSIGVNIFFQINKQLAKMMASRKEYVVSIQEIHHTQKKDAPSGTAITLAQQIIAERDDKSEWTLDNSPQQNQIGITSTRTDPAPGTHHIMYSSPVDNIEITHTAHNRKGFAAGALIASEYIAGRKGIFSMEDVLKM